MTNNLKTKVRVKDIAEINNATYSTSDKWDYVHYLDTGSITNNKIEELQYIDLLAEELPSRAKRKVGIGDIIYSTVRPNQRHFGIISQVPSNFLISTGFCSIHPNTLKVNPYYLYYLLTQDEIVSALHAIAEQSVSAYPSIKPSDIGNLQFELPDLLTQRKIAAVLKSLDDKIELNNKINENLEQQAIVAFKMLFETTEATKNSAFGIIPKAMQITKVGQLPMLVTDYVANGSFASLKANVKLYQEPNYAHFIRNTDLKDGAFNVYVDKHSYDFLAKSCLYGDEIIISNVGDVGSVFLCPTLNRPMTLGNNIIMLRPEISELRYYLYVWFKYMYGKQQIQGIKGGSAQPKFNKTDFKNLDVILPPDDTLKKYNNYVSPLFNKISTNKQENKTLAELRDSLLPKLMSGEIDVNNVKI